MSIIKNFNEKAGMKFILISIKGLSKNKLLTLLSICVTCDEKDKEKSKQIFNTAIDEYKKRNIHEKNYDLKELDSYLKVLGDLPWEEKK